MPIITVTIDSRTYRMSCGKGEEAHLTALTEDFSERIAQMRTNFGEIGDMRLHVMAALTFADELADLRKRFTAMETEVAAARGVVEAATRSRDEAAARAAEGIGRAAGRIARLADALAAPPGTAVLPRHQEPEPAAAEPPAPEQG
jgi:cell division protein ZapA